MLCQDCKKREAQVHFTQIVNNEKTTLSLCKDCAAARGFHSPLENAPFPLAEILSGLTESTPAFGANDTAEQQVCPNCGLSFNEFARLGRFGCGKCYQTFRVRIEPIMRKIHGASLHRGRSPINQIVAVPGTDRTVPIKEEERLKAELTKAIESEEFERAAEIRDKLKTIQEAFTIEQ